VERIARSFLFVPGDRPDRFQKAVSSGAHAVILDLEDAVSPATKGTARDAVADWLSRAPATFVRINPPGTPWFEDDASMLRPVSGATLVLPKADPDSVARAAAMLPGRPIIALIESVSGVIGLRELAAIPQVCRIAFGSIDFGAETGIADEGDAMTAIRTQIVLESCHARLQPPVDGVTAGFDDEEAMRRDALRSRQLGFGGKLCIHPRQVAAVNSAFRPEPSQVQWAERVLAAFEESEGGVTTVDGVMVDKPVVEQARRIIADAE